MDMEREKLIEEMVEAYFGYNKTGCKTDMGDVLDLVEKHFVEKHARIANLHEGCSASQMESLRCEAGEEIADAILATVEKKDD